MSSYVLAELGDKTMLATVALASDDNWAGVWLGATLAMVLADGLAIAVGALLHQRLPERFLHAMASVLFLLFGLWLLFRRGPRLARGGRRRHGFGRAVGGCRRGRGDAAHQGGCPPRSRK